VLSLRHKIDVEGGYFTAGARIHVYRYHDRLQGKAIYCYTGFDIFIEPRYEPGPIQTGERLGEMTYELRPTEYIS